MLEPVPCILERQFVNCEGIFYLSDAEELMPSLIRDYQNTVQLIYLDPPFRTGSNFKMFLGKTKIEVPCYSDKLDHEQYFHMMSIILTGCHALLNKEGSLYLHADQRVAAELKLMMDDIFGTKNFRNEIIWAYQSGGRSKRTYPHKHDTILFYGKTKNTYFDLESVSKKRGAIRRNHMKLKIDPEGKISYSIRSGGKTYTYYEDDLITPSDVWADIPHLHQRNPERTGYATQKPEALLTRIIAASSKPNDIVMDLFSGSGTTAVAAAKLQRKFIAADSSPVAQFCLRKRLYDQLGSTKSFFDESGALVEYHFPLDTVCMNIQLHKEEQTNTNILYELTMDTAILYCAIGYIEKNAFTPYSSYETPSFPVTFSTPLFTVPALHIMALDGKQVFFKI